MPAHGSAGAAPTNSPGKENGQSGHAPCAGDHSLVNGGGPTGVMGVMAASGQPPTANPAGDLPPAIGAPHLYHVGAEGFFLDQGSAVGLSPDQEAKLSAIKEKAGVAYAASQRKGAEAENDLWLLTSAEKPEITKIDAKISEIGRLVAQQRTDYIRAVGSAVAVLSDDQRKVIVASNPAAMPAAVASSPMKPDAPMPPGGQMGGSKMGGSKMGGSKMGGMEHGSIPMKPAMAPPGGMAAGGSPPGMAPGMGHM